jgi:hypothetical protein
MHAPVQPTIYSTTCRFEGDRRSLLSILGGRKDALEVRLAAVEKDLNDREAGLAKEGDERVASLQGALVEEQERLAKARKETLDACAARDGALGRLREAEDVKDGWRSVEGHLPIC